MAAAYKDVDQDPTGLGWGPETGVSMFPVGAHAAGSQTTLRSKWLVQVSCVVAWTRAGQEKWRLMEKSQTSIGGKLFSTWQRITLRGKERKVSKQALRCGLL